MSDAPAKKPARGGVRQGAGRPRKRPIQVAPDATPLDVLRAIALDPETPTSMKLKAAASWAQYVHARPAAVPAPGKKEQRQADASKVLESGRFKPSRPPLRAVESGKK